MSLSTFEARKKDGLFGTILFTKLFERKAISYYLTIFVHSLGLPDTSCTVSWPEASIVAFSKARTSDFKLLMSSTSLAAIISNWETAGEL